MKNKSFYVIAVAAVMLFLSSCDKEESIQSTETSQSITLKNGMIIFNTSDDFEKTIESLMKNQNNLDQWEKNFNGFTSMRTAYDNLSEDDMQKIASNKSSHHFRDILKISDDQEPEALMNIDDEVLATLVNEQGLLQIGNEVYKFRYDMLYKTAYKDLDKLANIDNYSKADLKNNNIETFEVSHNYFVTELSENFKADRTCDRRYWKKDRKRLKGEQWTTNLGSLYSGAGARTKHQKKTLGIWWRNKTQRLRLRLNGNYTQVFQGIPQPPIAVNEDSGWATDDGREAYTFDFCVNVNCSFQINSLTSTHECTCDDGNYESCSIVF